MILNNNNYILYAAQHYVNPSCYGTAEFYDDLKRISYIRRLFQKYQQSNDLRDRLILNHLIVLFNVFDEDAIIKLLFLRLTGYHHFLKPFLVFLNKLPTTVIVGQNKIYTSSIGMDPLIVSMLRSINARSKITDDQDDSNN